MTKVTFYQNSDLEYIGFTVEDHAGYAEENSDIVCTSISVLVINTINSIEKLTEDAFTADENQEKACIKFEFDGNHSKSAVCFIIFYCLKSKY